MALIDTLTATFAGADLTAKFPNRSMTNVAETGGQLVVTPSPGYDAARTANIYSLEQSYVAVEVAQPAALGNGSQEVFLIVNPDGANELSLWRSGADLICRYMLAGTNFDTTTPFDGTQMRWWRIRVPVGGIVYWETSPDGLTWTTRRSRAIPFPLNQNTLQLQLGAGYWGTETPTAALFDNLNLLPAPPVTPPTVRVNVPAQKPPLGLSVEITTAGEGRYRWDSSDRDPGNVPRSLSFSTKRGDGFANCSLTLARRIDRDYVELNLYDSIALVGDDGSIAYEGRLASPPRSLSDGHSISPQFVGWMAHARDRKLSEVYIDRALSAWQNITAARTGALYAGAWRGFSGPTVEVAGGTTPAALKLVMTGSWATPQIAEALYDAGPTARLHQIAYNLQSPNTIGNPDWHQDSYLGTLNWFPTFVASGGFGASTGDKTLTAPDASPARYGMVQMYYNPALLPAGTSGQDYYMQFAYMQAIGDHGLPLVGSGLADRGVLASDVMRHVIAKYCPKLNASGVQATTFPIPHLAYKTRVDPYDVFLDVNNYHLWNLAVWENRTVWFTPVSTADYDWQVRLSDPGTTVDLQGDSTDGVANGIVVEYQDAASGNTDALTPDVYSELRDDSPDNPANRQGIPAWTEISLTIPTTATAALQIGRAALAEFNSPKAPGTIGVVGHIRDRAGNWQPAWRPRAGERIAIIDHPNDDPRLIAETSWDHDGKRLSITLDAPARRLDAILDRIALATSASNL